MTHCDLEVELPGQESFVRMARLVVAGFATASSDIDEARLGGLRMAVSEACQLALERRAPADRGTPLRLRTRMEDGQLHVWVEDSARGIDNESLRLAEALVSELEVSDGPRGSTVAHLVVDAGPLDDATGR